MVEWRSVYTLSLRRALVCPLGLGKPKALKKIVGGLDPWSRSQWNQKSYIQVPLHVGLLPASRVGDLSWDGLELQLSPAGP